MFRLWLGKFSLLGCYFLAVLNKSKDRKEKGPQWNSPTSMKNKEIVITQFWKICFSLSASHIGKICEARGDTNLWTGWNLKCLVFYCNLTILLQSLPDTLIGKAGTVSWKKKILYRDGLEKIITLPLVKWVKVHLIIDFQ